MSTEKSVSRPVRIYLAMEDGPLPRSIRQVLGVVGEPKTHCFVENESEADLVISDDLREIEKGYKSSKAYGLLDKFGRGPKDLPTNVTNLVCNELLMTLINLIKQVWLDLKPLETPKVEPVIPEVPLRADALRILVIEDTPKHQASAKAGLAGHKLTVATGYEEAMKILGNEKFDVVLTDLQMPMSSRTLGGDAFKLGELVPYGLFLRDEAAHRGTKYVAVVTELGHHDNWVSAAFDHFCYSMQIDGAKVMNMHAPMTQNADGERVKDWAEALDRLMKD